MAEHWKKLIEKALEILEMANMSPEEWSFGGGSALTMYYHHRESFDVDIFVTDAQHLLLLTPRLASFNVEIRDYTEMSNFVKLKLDEGEIDFILAPHLNRDWYVEKTIMDRKIRIETPWEIVTKKLFYRPESLKIRDIIDTAVVLKNERKKMSEQIPIIAPKFEIIDLRWKNVKEFYEKEAEKLIIHDKSIVDIGKKVFDDYLAEIKIYLKI
ncbi:nucleotidyl transferase AbiEii/AbiGii toxin family protein [Thermoanaerobacterium sp. DL9XJH110]|uniref:nucleotidyl transferase AbiEii/AbiGii toxin family protein n=1 Tax=Thermoanaerobacterium sp. DL9XJH110 TaxID=3386643 RepID=UPI003BB74436